MDALSIGILVFLGVGLIIYSALPRKRGGHEAVKRRREGRRAVDEVADIKEQARATAPMQQIGAP